LSQKHLRKIFLHHGENKKSTDTSSDKKEVIVPYELKNDAKITQNGENITQNALVKTKCEVCNKQYSSAGNLWKHKRRCFAVGENGETKTKNTDLVSPDILVRFIKENKELRNILVEQNSKLLHQNEEQTKIIAELAQKQVITTTNNTTNNKTTNNFNLHVFLNDTCKDALNITDFVKSLKIQVSDLEETGKLGYVDGITRIILNGLKNVEVEKRPLHCTDLKRETVYIKNDNIWEKENPDKSHLKNAVEHISHLNLQQLRPWQEMHPLYKDTTTKENDMFIHLSTQAIGSCSRAEGDRNVEKILKNVLKEVVLDKGK
jgi:hypothetical protein